MVVVLFVVGGGGGFGLGIVVGCWLFLSDSVEESSQDTISCMRGSDCHV